MSAEQIRREVHNRWGNEPIVSLCDAILNYMESVPRAQLEMLTFASLQAATSKEVVDADLLLAITILSSSSVAALDAHAMLVDEDSTEHEIPLSDLSAARAGGQLIHPETGYPVEDFETKIFPFFVPSAKFDAAAQ
ncbi:hypothetical protein AB7828_10100 [Tardiphaga sp. 215_C5_N2_1]|uniref:hypothetical protein n=1 Tax=Tardiphaga sp. 215_C5_N2_1 TaxID=3240774 RepID=UPI003F891D21